jgi:hypothetical protein
VEAWRRNVLGPGLGLLHAGASKLCCGWLVQHAGALVRGCWCRQQVEVVGLVVHGAADQAAGEHYKGLALDSAGLVGRPRVDEQGRA